MKTHKVPVKDLHTMHYDNKGPKTQAAFPTTQIGIPAPLVSVEDLNTTGTVQGGSEALKSVANMRNRR